MSTSTFDPLALMNCEKNHPSLEKDIPKFMNNVVSLTRNLFPPAILDNIVANATHSNNSNKSNPNIGQFEFLIR